MSSRKYNVIIIGLGNIGFLYDLNNKCKDNITSHAKAFSHHQKFKIIAGVDVNHAKRKCFEKEYRVKTFEDIESAFKNEIVDVIVISCNTNKHNQVLRKILNLQIKNKTILCEKPISDNFNESNDLLKKLKSLKNHVYVNYMRRADPSILEIKNRIKNGLIKKPIKGLCFYSRGIYNNASHLIDLLIYIFGEVKNYKLISRKINNNINDPDVDFNIEFDKVSINFLSLPDVNFSVLTGELYSDSGRLYYENEGRKITFFHKIDCPNFNGFKIIEEKGEIIKNQMNISQLNVVNELLNAIELKDNKLCTSYEALYSLELINNILNLKNE